MRYLNRLWSPQIASRFSWCDPGLMMRLAAIASTAQHMEMR